ncbi:membrane traffic protein [Lithospermum erythrorhizon]|uniref:Membrane traffic protein n=1 Tax=Lithospermum erythrorhizon TaxID=34254 RepID=A0AAV3RHY7_LITER
MYLVSREENEIEEGTRRKKPKVRDTTEEELESALAEIDPEGSALHDIIKRISKFSGSSWSNLLYSRILGRCSLLISGIDVLVQSPSPDDPFLLILGLKEFSMRPHLNLRGPYGKVFFDLDINGFTIGLRSKSYSTSILPPTDFRICITFYNFQLTDIVISVPSLCFAFSPTDLSVILLFCLLSSRKSHYTRNGLQLWRIVASKMSHLISDPRLSLNRVVGDVYQWMLYLRSYQNVLSLMGYPEDDRMKKSAMMVFRDRTFSDSLNYRLRIISDIEKKLPAHAIVQARRIARQEAILRAQELKNIDQQVRPNKLVWKIFHILALAWDFICSLFLSLFSILLFQSHSKNFDHLEGIKEDSLPRLCIILEVGEVSLSTSPSYEDFSSPRVGLDSKAGVSYENLVSFRFSVDALFARYSQHISKKCLSFAFGSLEILPTSAVNDSSNSRKYMSGQQKNKSNNMKSVLWTEPARFISFGETVQVNPSSTGEASMTYLESLVGTLWSNWKNLHQNVGENMRESLEYPFIICESKFLLTNQSLKGHSSGIWNCGLVVGKFNIFLEYSSIISMAVLVGQIQNALSWESNQTYVVSQLGTLVDDLLTVGWSGMFKSYMKRAQMEIVGLSHEKHLQIGAIIAGPLIQVSVREDHFGAVDADICHVIQKDNMLFSVQVDDIDLLVLPDINSLLASPIRQNKTIDTQLKDCQLKIHKEVSGHDISKGEISLGGYLKLDGLKAYIGQPSEVSAYRLITIGPTTTTLSSLRYTINSFAISLKLLVFQWIKYSIANSCPRCLLGRDVAA